MLFNQVLKLWRIKGGYIRFLAFLRIAINIDSWVAFVPTSYVSFMTNLALDLCLQGTFSFMPYLASDLRQQGTFSFMPYLTFYLRPQGICKLMSYFLTTPPVFPVWIECRRPTSWARGRHGWDSRRRRWAICHWWTWSRTSPRGRRPVLQRFVTGSGSIYKWIMFQLLNIIIDWRTKAENFFI